MCTCTTCDLLITITCLLPHNSPPFAVECLCRSLQVCRPTGLCEIKTNSAQPSGIDTGRMANDRKVDLNKKDSDISPQGGKCRKNFNDFLFQITM